SIREAVRVVGYLPDEEVAALMNAATAFLFPSLYEGFGMPILEAMACGCPVICSNRSSLPEVVDDAGVLVDPTEPKILSAAIEEVLTNIPHRRRLREKGLDRVRRFSWDRTASELLTVYQRVGQLN
ncbi:MAG: glycosyltransferase family 4 protein, partial [Nitrospinae bacterium]|nr:glycosyltransferase family 4 protein [Nitrospinota bacterium]